MKINHDLLYGPCPCGSGKKFKFCCFESVRDSLPCNPGRDEVAEAVRRATQPYGKVNDIDPVEDRDEIEVMREGADHRHESEWDDAVELFRKARTMKPKLFTAWDNEAQCLWMRGDFADAVACLKEGLGLSADVNAYGWAALAEAHYFLGDDKSYAECVGKAFALKPQTAYAAARVCTALARTRRYKDILSYALRSGFDNEPHVAAFAGVAAANLGKFDEAERHLRAAQDEDLLNYVQRETLEDLEYGDEESGFPCGEWMYFDLDSYGCGPVAGIAAARRSPADRNVVCDIAEIMLAEGTACKGDALEALAGYSGGRADTLRKWLESTDAYDEIDDTYERLPTSGGKIAMQRMLESLGVYPVILDDTVSISGCRPLEGKDGEDYTEATRVSMCGTAGTKKWVWARRRLSEIAAARPDMLPARQNYAAMLEKEGRTDAALEIMKNLHRDHPDYLFAATSAAVLAVTQGTPDEAKRILDSFTLPVRMHPTAYKAWNHAWAMYYLAVGDIERARNARLVVEDIDRMMEG